MCIISCKHEHSEKPCAAFGTGTPRGCSDMAKFRCLAAVSVHLPPVCVHIKNARKEAARKRIDPPECSLTLPR